MINVFNRDKIIQETVLNQRFLSHSKHHLISIDINDTETCFNIYIILMLCAIATILKDLIKPIYELDHCVYEQQQDKTIESKTIFALFWLTFYDKDIR